MTKPNPLSTHASGVLGSLVQHGPEPTRTINPGVVDKLVREGYARLVSLPSPLASKRGACEQHLEAIPEAERTAPAPAPDPEEHAAAESMDRSQPKRPAKRAQTAAKGEGAGEPRVTKGATVLALMQRPEGATNGEIMEATGWLTHTVRGFLAGSQLVRMGYKAEPFTRDDGAKAYRAAKREDRA